MSHGGVTQESVAPRTKLERVGNRETSGCRNCEPGQMCEDSISFEPLKFPAYKSMETSNCYNDDTVRKHIKSQPLGVEPRDPVSRAVWDLPSELLDVHNTTQDDHMEADPDTFSDVHLPQIIHLMQTTGYEAARQLYYDMRNFAHFDLSVIVTMFQIGMEPEARNLYHFTKNNRVKSYSAEAVERLYEIGMTDEACDLHLQSVSSFSSSWATDPLLDPYWVPTYRASDVIKLFEIGMEVQAFDLHMQSLKFAYEYSAVDIVALAEAGMKGEGLDLHIQTLDKIMEMSNDKIVDAIVALTRSTVELKPLAEELLMRG